MEKETVKRAARAFIRVWNPMAEQLAYAADADAGFDGGEWSAPAHGALREYEFEKCIARVAERFGVTAESLEQEVSRQQHC